MSNTFTALAASFTRELYRKILGSLRTTKQSEVNRCGCAIDDFRSGMKLWV